MLGLTGAVGGRILKVIAGRSQPPRRPPTVALFSATTGFGDDAFPHRQPSRCPSLKERCALTDGSVLAVPDPHNSTGIAGGGGIVVCDVLGRPLAADHLKNRPITHNTGSSAAVTLTGLGDGFEPNCVQV
jgi:hypothetical protein